VLDSVRDIRFSTVFLVSIIVLGTLIVVWLLIPDLSTGPTPVKIQRPPAAASPKPADDADSSNPAADPEIVVEVAGGSGSQPEVVNPPGTRAVNRAPDSGTRPAAQAEAVPDKPVQSRSGKGQFLLQAGAFAKAGGATARVAEVQKLGLMVRLEESLVDGTELTRVLVGPFETRQQADEVLAKLNAAKIDSFVRKVD